MRDQTKSITISSSLDLLVVAQFSGAIFFPSGLHSLSCIFCLCPQCKTTRADCPGSSVAAGGRRSAGTAEQDPVSAPSAALS